MYVCLSHSWQGGPGSLVNNQNPDPIAVYLCDEWVPLADALQGTLPGLELPAGTWSIEGLSIEELMDLSTVTFWAVMALVVVSIGVGTFLGFLMKIRRVS